MANHILTKMSYEDYVNPKIPENGVTKQNLNNLCKFITKKEIHDLDVK